MGINRLDGYKNILVHNSFEAEFEALFKGDTKQFRDHLKKLRQRLDMLEYNLLGCVDGVRIEKLQGTKEPLYSIRFKSKINPRVIYFTIEDQFAVLLSAQRETKTSDYNLLIRRSEKRVTEIRRELYKWR